MSIKQVTCPHCRATMNVMASMASVQCQSCGKVFAPGQPTPATPAAAPAARPANHSESTDDDKGQLLIWTIVGGIGAVVLFAIVLFAAFQFVGDGSAEREAAKRADEELQRQRDERLKADYQAYEPAPEGEPQYREINLPEATRKQIYSDYRKMFDSSFGKARRIPRSGVAGQQLRGALGGIVDREISRFSAIHGVSEDDIRQVIAEGDAKEWAN